MDSSLLPKVKQHVPTLADEESIFPYKRLESMARRIDRAAILRIESMTAKYFNAEIWPASWWRDTKCLLPGARQTQGSMPAPLAQELFVARTLKEAPEHVLSFAIFGLNHTLGLFMHSG